MNSSFLAISSLICFVNIPRMPASNRVDNISSFIFSIFFCDILDMFLTVLSVFYKYFSYPVKGNNHIFPINLKYYGSYLKLKCLKKK